MSLAVVIAGCDGQVRWISRSLVAGQIRKNLLEANPPYKKLNPPPEMIINDVVGWHGTRSCLAYNPAMKSA
jgi:hypothetical protein